MTMQSAKGWQIVSYYRAGRSVAVMADRFGLDPIDIVAVLNRQGIAIVDEGWFRDQVNGRTWYRTGIIRPQRKRRFAA